MTSEDRTKGLLSELLSLDSSGKGASMPGLTGSTSTKTSDETVGATIRLDQLSKNEIQNIMSILKPYDKNMTMEVTKDPDATADRGHLGLDLKDHSEMLPTSYNLKKNLSVDASAAAPDISLDGPSGKINMPEGFGSDLSGPNLNGDLPSLTLNKPSVDSGGTFSIPTTGLNGTNVKGGDLGGTLKAPSYNLKQDLSLDASAKAPGISFDGPSGKLNAPQGFEGNISPPTVNGDFPSLSVNKPSVDSGAKLSMPNAELTGPNIKGADLNVSPPKLNTPSASLDINKPQIKTGGKKYKPSKFKMPNFNLPQTQFPTGKLDDLDVSGTVDTPNLKLKALELDTKNPDLALNGPKLDLSVPDGNLEAPTSKIKWPHQNWKGPNASLASPEIDGDLKVPDADIQAPNLDIESHSKMNWLHSKFKKPKLHTPKADVALDAPDVDVNLPKADIESPNLDVDANIGKKSWPHLKWKKVKAPKADIDIDPIDTNLSTPTFEGKINAPRAELDLPEADLKGPELHAPDLDAGASLGKINWPHLKAKTPKVQGLNADLDADLKSPDLSVSPPKVGLDLPSAHLDKPSLDCNAPNLDVDAPSGNIKLPTLKKPKFSGFKVKNPDLDADVSAPDLSLSSPKIDGNLNTPDVNIPRADLDTPKLDIDTPDLETSTGKFKWPTFKKPKFSGPKAKGPDFDTDLTAPELSLKAPNIDGDLNAPDVNLPKVDLESPKLDVDAPDLETSTGKFKWPTFKKPKFSGLKAKGPNVDADVSAPDLSLSTPQIGDIKGPDANLPKLDMETPKLDVDAPDVGAPSGKIKFPTLKKPKFGTFKGLKHDINADANLPDLNLKGPGLNLDTPDASLSAPKIDTPDFELTTPKADINGPDMGLNGVDLNLDPKLKLPGSEITAPNLDLKASGPSLNAPKIEGTDLDIDLPKADLKGPKWPKFGFSSPKVKGPSLDVDSDLKAPDLSLPDGKVGLSGVECNTKDVDVNLSSPKLNGNLLTPTAGVNVPSLDGPDVHVKPPDVDTAMEKQKFPHFKFPKFGFSKGEGDVEVNGVDAETNTANADVVMPVFKMHKLPKSSIDDSGGISDTFDKRRNEIEAKDFIIRKGVCLPVINAPNKSGEKVDIMERLKMAREKVPAFNLSPTDEQNNFGMNLGAPSLDDGDHTETGNSNLLSGGTFKVQKPESGLGLERPNVSTADENDKFKFGLSNMLGLNIE